MEKINEEIMDKLKKVCICKAISKAKIKAAIADGADTLEKVQKVTGSGSGGCCGNRCNHKVVEILKEYNK